MSVPEGTDRPDDERETLAAIAAVEGLGVLGESERRAVDEDRVRDFEMAAGAVFSALGGGPSIGQPSGVVDRLEVLLSSRLEALGGRPTSDGRGHRSSLESMTRRNTTGAHGRPESTDRSRARGDDPAFEAPASPPAPGPRPTSPWPSFMAVSGWVAAAALVVAMVLTAGRIAELEELAGLGDPWARRAELLEVAPDTQVLAWQTQGVEGDVAWSDERNEGYMTIEGLPVNDPNDTQYQLWIFRGTDPGAELHPVDGGLFDVSREGRVIVPIDAKIDVGRAGLFAVTVEKPGGVVVSDREQIVLIAARA